MNARAGQIVSGGDASGSCRRAVDKTTPAIPCVRLPRFRPPRVRLRSPSGLIRTSARPPARRPARPGARGCACSVGNSALQTVAKSASTVTPRSVISSSRSRLAIAHVRATSSGAGSNFCTCSSTARSISATGAPVAGTGGSRRARGCVDPIPGKSQSKGRRVCKMSCGSGDRRPKKWPLDPRRALRDPSSIFWSPLSPRRASAWRARSARCLTTRESSSCQLWASWPRGCSSFDLSPSPFSISLTNTQPRTIG
jgi:hypothetical protein